MFMKTVNLLFSLLSIFLCSSCALQLPAETDHAEASGIFSLFLQPLPQEAHLLTFTIKDIVLRRADGHEVPLVPLQKIFPAVSLIGVQKRLVSAVLPYGQYDGLAIRIGSVTLRGEEGEIDLLPPEDMLIINHQFTIMKERPETLFLSLSPERLVTNGVIFTPKFSMWKPVRLLPNFKGFVSNSFSDSLTVFDKKNGLVIGAINPGLGPKGMALDQQRGWLYVALARENIVSAIEVSNGEILGKVRLRFGDEPSELVLSPSGRILVCINRGSNTVSIIDTASLSERGRIRLTSEPTWVFMGRDESLAYVISASSGTLSLLDLAGEKVRASVDLEDPPIKGTVTGDGSLLYLVTGFSGHLLEVDAASLAITKKIFVGVGALSIKADSLSGLIYIGKESGEIAVVDPRSLMVIDSFSLSGPVQHLTIDNEENALFAVMPGKGILQKIDLVSKQPRRELELERDSHAVVVMGER